MFPSNHGFGIPGFSSVVKKRRRRKKPAGPLDPETERQERELRLKIQQSLHTQQASRKEIENESGGSTEKLNDNNNNDFTSMLTAQQQRQQKQFQFDAPNDQMYGYNHNRGASITDSGMSEGVGTNPNIAQKIHQIEQQFAEQLEQKLKMKMKQEIQILHAMPFVHHVSKGLPQYALPGADQFQQRYDSSYHVSPEFTAVPSPVGNFTSHQLNQQLQQQTIRRQAEYLPYQQQLNLLHPYGQQQPGSDHPHNTHENNGQPFHLQNQLTHQRQQLQQQLHLLQQYYPQKRIDPPYNINIQENNGHDIQQHVTDKQQQVEQNSIPAPQKPSPDESGSSFSSSMSESWLKGSTDSGYAFHSVGNLSDSRGTSGRSMVSMMDNTELPNPSKGYFMKSGSAVEAVEGRMNDSRNYSSKSARTDESSGGDDGAQSVRQRNKTDDSEAHGHGNHTTPFMRNSHTSPTKTNATSESNSSTMLDESMKHKLSIESKMMEELMKRSCETFDAGGIGTDINVSNLSSVTGTDMNVSNISSVSKVAPGGVGSSLDAEGFKHLLSIDSRMMEELMKGSCQTFVAGGTGTTEVAPGGVGSSLDAEGYKHIFSDLGSSSGNKPTCDSPSPSRDKHSSSNRRRSTLTIIPSIMSKISHWTKDNPFENSVNITDDNEAHGNVASESNSSTTMLEEPMKHKLSGEMMEELMKRSCEAFDAGGIGTEINLSNLSSVTLTDMNISNISSATEVAPGGVGSSLDAEGYKHIFFDSGSSSGNKPTGDSPSSSRDKYSSSRRRRSSNHVNPSIMSEISHWTKDNPFEDSDSIDVSGKKKTDEREYNLCNYSSNDSCKIARTDKSSSVDRGAQSVKQRNKAYDDDAHGDGNATTLFRKNSHTSPSTIAVLHSIQENEMSEVDSSKVFEGSVLSNHTMSSSNDFSSPIIQWTKENPFEDSVDARKGTNERENDLFSEQGLSLLSMMSSMMSSISSVERMGDSMRDSIPGGQTEEKDIHDKEH